MMSAALDDAHGEAGQLEGMPVAVLGHLATDQRAPGLAAAVRHAGHERLDDGGLDARRGDVVEEQERVRALDGDVVDAHRHQVDADRVEAPGATATRSLVPTPSVDETSTGSR
jgi:hypothetical protein